MTMTDSDQRTGRRETAELMAELGRGAEELANSAAWQQMLRVQARFHRYSPLNQLLIWAQMPDATRVAGYRKWQELGRQVRKGEQGLTILAPRIVKRDDDETGEVRRVVRGFGHAKVFDISQTDGDPLPEVEWPAAGSAPAGLYDRLVLASMDGDHVRYVKDLEKPGITDPQGARGWFSPESKFVTIIRAAEPQMCSTLLHELGHAHDPLLHGEDDVLGSVRRQTRELVAESVCYVLGRPLGVDVEAEAFHYIASWRGDAVQLARLAQRVGTAVDSIRKTWAIRDPSLVDD